jgi:exonuclease VII small subunit
LESSRLHERIEYLDSRIAKLDDSVRSLESGLDQRLSQMASDTLRNTRSELEGAAETVLKEWTTRNVQALGNQLDEACENMKIVQKGIVASVSESLKVQSADALQSFEHSMQDLAKLSVERWRLTLAGGLNALVKNLGEQFRLEAEPGNDENQR